MKSFMTTATTQRNPNRRPAIFLGSAMIALFALGSGVALERAAATDLTAQVSGDRFERGYADLLETLLPAVVNVQIQRNAPGPVARGGLPEQEVPEFFRRFFDDMPQGQPAPRGPVMGEGSGFIIEADGFIVTNAHVVDGADSISVTLTGGRELEAELIGVDVKTDLALLKIEADEPLPFVKFGDSETVRVGDKVLAVGNPFGLGGTVTSGIVSAMGRRIGAGPYDDFLQIDAAINRGNSGGPAFNLDGEVIGVNSVIYSPSGGNVGIGFAISANLAEQIVADLRDDGNVERGWLGVNIQSMDEELASAFGLENTTGALVSKVEPGSPAAEAGVVSGDVILAYNDTPIETLSDLSTFVAATDPGSDATVKLWRNGDELDLDVTIDLMPSQDQVAALVEDESDQAPLGLALAELTGSQRAEAGLQTNQGGVLVTSVEPGSAAASKGMGEGDIILRIGEEEVNSPQDITDQVRSALDAGKDTLLVLLHQEGGTRFLTLPLAVS